MVAAPQVGFCKFEGASGKIYVVNIYASDVANGEVNFDSGAGASATSRLWWQPPERCVLVDFAIHTGMTDTTKVRITKGGQPTGSILVFAAQLDTSNARPRLAEGFDTNMSIGMVQLA